MFLPFPTLDMGRDWVSGFDREWFQSLFLQNFCDFVIRISQRYWEAQQWGLDRVKAGCRIQLEVKKTNIDPIASGDRVKLYKFHMHATEKTNMAELGRGTMMRFTTFVHFFTSEKMDYRQTNRWMDVRTQPHKEMRERI